MALFEPPIIKKDYSLEYKGKPATLKHENYTLKPNMYFIETPSGKRIYEGNLTSDKGKQISVSRKFIPLPIPHYDNSSYHIQNSSKDKPLHHNQNEGSLEKGVLIKGFFVLLGFFALFFLLPNITGNIIAPNHVQLNVLWVTPVILGFIGYFIWIKFLKN